LARDDFRIVGVPAGTPLVFAAEWNYNFIGSFEASFGARIGQGDTPTLGGGTGANGQPFFSQAGRFVYELNVNAGDVFRLTTELSAGTGQHGGADASGFLRFSGLPAGARVESCQGYVQDIPVPAMRASWGSVKSLYRGDK
jgi:hypothetical protein